MKLPLTSIPLALIGVFSLTVASSFGQGPLTPPGAPAPTMKTLTQIEPRTNLSSLMPPGTPLTLPITISGPGSYYVDTNNLTLTSTNSGITIAASDVTLDLMGFTLTGAAGTLDAITVTAGHNNIVIRNGILAGWGGFGINASGASGCQICNIIVVSNGGGGILTGSGSRIVNCQASSMAFSGFTVGNNSIVKDCIATTTDFDGFLAGSNVVISGCSASFNAGNGIVTGDSATISSCTAAQNGNPNFSFGAGIAVGDSCTIVGCSVSSNGTASFSSGSSNAFAVNGISTGANCLIKDCSANSCVDGNGISTGALCKVKDCIANNNKGYTYGGVGIFVGDSSSVTGCTASGNQFYGAESANYCTFCDNTILGNDGNGYDVYLFGNGNTAQAKHRDLGKRHLRRPHQPRGHDCYQLFSDGRFGR